MCNLIFWTKTQGSLLRTNLSWLIQVTPVRVSFHEGGVACATRFCRDADCITPCHQPPPGVLWSISETLRSNGSCVRNNVSKTLAFCYSKDTPTRWNCFFQRRELCPNMSTTDRSWFLLGPHLTMPSQSEPVQRFPLGQNRDWGLHKDLATRRPIARPVPR